MLLLSMGLNVFYNLKDTAQKYEKTLQNKREQAILSCVYYTPSLKVKTLLHSHIAC